MIRKGISLLVKMIKKVPGIKEVTMTSNGVLLKDLAEELYQSGLDGINISLDTLNRKKYHDITRRDQLEEVLLGIEKACQIGLKTKLNCVPIRGFNEDELADIATLTKNKKIDVRFIELMPIGLGKEYEFLPFQEVKDILEQKFGPGISSPKKHGNGPAIYLDFQDFLGSIGFISAITHEFCEDCNRIRMTAEGDLKLCLNHNIGISLRTLVRSQISEEELQKSLIEIIEKKPLRHCFHEISGDDVERKNMVQIGG